jgi:hypothetical protein
MELKGTIWIKKSHSIFSKCHRRKMRMPNQELQRGSEFFTCGQIPSSNKKEKRWLVVESKFWTCHSLKKLKNIYVSTMCDNFGLSLLLKNHLFSGNIYNCTKVNVFRVLNAFFNEGIFKVPRCITMCSLSFQVVAFPTWCNTNIKVCLHYNFWCHDFRTWFKVVEKKPYHFLQ